MKTGGSENSPEAYPELHKQATVSLGAHMLPTSSPKMIPPEEPNFHKCTEGTSKIECLLWFQDLLVLESNTHPPP